MLTTPTKTPDVLINVRCWYAKQDTAHKEQLAIHLESLLHRDKIAHLRFEEINDLMEQRFSVHTIVKNTDLLLFLVSSSFLAADFSFSTELSYLLEARNLGNIQLIPLVFTPCRIETSILHKLPRLPSNVLPLINEHTEGLDHPLFVISGELETRIDRLRYRKEQVETAWKEALARNEYRTYRDFIEKFPFTLQRREAQRRADEMLEAKLWKEAESLNDTTHLLHYLKDAPEIPAKAQHKPLALDRLTEIEESEAIAGNDAIDSQNLPLLFNYLQRFPTGSQAAKAHTQISDLMDDLLNGRRLSENLEVIGEREEDAEEIHDIKTEGLKLRYLILHLLQPDELMALSSYYQFGEEIMNSAERQHHQLKGNAGMIMMAGPVMFLLGAMLYYVIGPRLIAWGWFLYLLAAFGLLLGYVLLLGYQHLMADAHLCRNMAIDLQRKLTELRISFLFRDRRSINRLLFEFFNVRGRLQQISALTLFYYLWGKGEESPGSS